MSEEKTNFAATIEELSIKANAIQYLDKDIPVAVCPNHLQVQSLEKFLELPIRNRGTTLLRDVNSFIEFVKEYSNPNSRIYCPTPTQFIAVLNHSCEDEGPQWGDYRAVLNLKTTLEWNTWFGATGRQMNQRDFAMFIEDNLYDIVKPLGADVLEMVRFFETTSTAEFRSAAPENEFEQKLEYTRTETNKAGQKGSQNLPREISIMVAAYEGGPTKTIDAKLRYSLSTEGKLTLRYELIKASKYLDSHIRDIADKIKTATTLPVFFGEPSNI